MKRVIFLNAEQKALLDSYGLGADCLLPQNIKKHLTTTDAYDIEGLSKALRAEGRVLSNYGFGFGLGSNTNNIDEPYLSPSIEEELKEFSSWRNLELDAECPDSETIVVWQVVGGVKPHCMLKDNLCNILKAMQRVMSFSELIASQQFELSVRMG